jgi:hypothetical protein
MIKEGKMLRKISLVVVAVILVSIVASCATAKTNTITVTKPVTMTSNVTSTSTVIATVTLVPTPTVTGTPTTKAGDLAALGANLYEANCAQTYCHASFNDPSSGGGFDAQPATVSFSKTNLSFFDDSANLFVFIKSFMHQANTKLNLTDDQYVQIIAYLLVQNGTLQSSSVFGIGNLATVKLLP